MKPETKKSIRSDRAFWQRVVVGAISIGAIGCIGLGGKYAHQRAETARWMQEARQSEQVKEIAVQAVGEMVDKVQGLEAQIALMGTTDTADPTPASRYAPITADEREMLARLIYLEAGAESFQCQQACAEVVLNRVAAENFPDTVEAVIYQEGQFTPAARIAGTTATEAQYSAVDAALEGDNLTPADVVYFNTTGENDRVWGTIDGVVFCRQYSWAADAS